MQSNQTSYKKAEEGLKSLAIIHWKHFISVIASIN